MSEAEKRFRHEKHYHYVSTHDVGHCLIGQRASCMILRGCAMIIIINVFGGIGFGLSFRVLSLSIDPLVSTYRNTERREIFLAYDGTLVPESFIIKIQNPYC